MDMLVLNLLKIYFDILMSYQPSSNNQDYAVSNIVNPYPFYNFWSNNPLSANSIIDPRRAGYHPYRKFVNVTEPEFAELKGQVYENACSTILPVYSEYVLTKQIVQQP